MRQLLAYRIPELPYRPILTASENRKGVLDVDTVKGCSEGMHKYPEGGCYGVCYAATTAKRYGRDFSVSVSRRPGRRSWGALWMKVRNHRASWYRVGTAGDPSHDWDNTVDICDRLKGTGKQPVIITKHWITMNDCHLRALKKLSAVVNTSMSPLDTKEELTHRMQQLNRINDQGVKSVARVVTCNFGQTEWALEHLEVQNRLLGLTPHIDNPLRIQPMDPRVINGHLLVARVPWAIGGGKWVSLHDKTVYLGTCAGCKDQCGALEGENVKASSATEFLDAGNGQLEMFPNRVEWECVPSVIGSGYEEAVSDLAIRDVIAKRAARKNMQIHSAVILKIYGKFRGFFTFQVNHVSKEFCLLQSVIEPLYFNPKLYREMVVKVIEQNTYGYPSIITTDPKSKFETPGLFESLGFITYLKMSGFCYMVKGDISTMRMKYLAHITMTNVWQSTKGDWLRSKAEWNDRINASGEAAGVQNACFATRDGCWQGTQGMANVVTKDPTKKGKEEGRSHNGNASVLDPVACEVIARFFMPSEGGRIYNPFGGGVQMGYVAGACGYEYLASEIRRNQCDANNAICSEFDNVKWVQSDSSAYDPPGEFDLIFSCPPYYKVERYLDYDGNPPEGEINSSPSYEEFMDLLFSGYRQAIAKLKDNRFFVVMTGDSRDKSGAYYCHEADTELFFKQNGLSIYNRIVYLEAEFTRLAHAKKTLHTRKFPKREQKIIVAYKGKISDIGKHFAPIGRL